MVMKGEHTVPLISMSADTTEMYNLFDTRLLNSLFVIIGNAYNGGHVIKFLVKEKTFTKGFHDIHNVCTHKSFGKKIYVFHSANSGFCSKRFDFPLSFGLTADYGYRVTALQQFFCHGFIDMSQ